MRERSHVITGDAVPRPAAALDAGLAVPCAGDDRAHAADIASVRSDGTIIVDWHDRTESYKSMQQDHVFKGGKRRAERHICLCFLAA